jgi:hypothetical protein
LLDEAVLLLVVVSEWISRAVSMRASFTTATAMLEAACWLWLFAPSSFDSSPAKASRQTSSRLSSCPWAVIVSKEREAPAFSKLREHDDDLEGSLKGPIGGYKPGRAYRDMVLF